MKKEKQEKVTVEKKSRRSFLKKAAVVAGGAAGVMGFPGVMKLSAAAPIKWKMQTCWDAGTVGYDLFKKFCAKVGEMTEGKLTIEGLPAGAIVAGNPARIIRWIDETKGEAE